MTISERILKVLKDRNMTQAEFAKQVGIATSTISEWKKKNCIFKINFQKIQKNLNFMVDKHNSQWYYN